MTSDLFRIFETWSHSQSEMSYKHRSNCEALQS